jgi:hypothetical protein
MSQPLASLENRIGRSTKSCFHLKTLLVIKMCDSKKVNSFVKLPVLCAAALVILANPTLWSQSRSDLDAAKRTLQKMGIGTSLFDDGQHDDGEANDGIYAGLVEQAKLAFNRGLYLADPRPTPLQPRTRIIFTIGSRGKIILYLDSQNKMKNTRNQATNIHIDKSLLPTGIEVNYGRLSLPVINFPDLIVSKIVVERVTLKAPEHVLFTFKIWIKNIGRVKSDITKIEEEVSPGNIHGTWPVRELNPGEELQLAKYVIQDYYLIGLDVQIRVIVDYEDKVIEGNEKNNTKVITFNTRTLVGQFSITFN